MSAQKNFDVSYNEIKINSKIIKDTVVSPLSTTVQITQDTWDYHVIADHPDREFLNSEINYQKILNTISDPDFIAMDKSNSNRLNYFNFHLITKNSQTTMKSIKIVTEKDLNSNTEDFVTCIVSSRISESFEDGRMIIYDRHDIN